MNYLLSTTEKYRVDTEDEAENLIKDIKTQASEEGYIVKNCSYALKEKKSKGEVIAAAYLVTITKEFGTFWEVDE